MLFFAYIFLYEVPLLINKTCSGNFTLDKTEKRFSQFITSLRLILTEDVPLVGLVQ